MAAKQELADQWSLIVIAFLLVFVAFGVPTYSMPFIYGAAMEEFGWSNAQVNLLSTAKFVIGAGAAVGWASSSTKPAAVGPCCSALDLPRVTCGGCRRAIAFYRHAGGSRTAG